MPPDKEGAMALHTPVTILIIDDESSFARGLALLLRRDGYTVDTVDNGCNRSHNFTCNLSSFRTLTRFKTLAICCLNRRPCR